jgi:predicted CXXCH cytochrome family protein
MFSKSAKRMLKNFSWQVTILLLAVFIVYLSGCSTSNNFKTLSFFFDGVPDPSKTASTQVIDSLSSLDTLALALNPVNKGPQMQLHSPYQDKQCNSCHDQSKMGKLIKNLPELCYQCHEDFSTRFKVLHGPVAGGQCSVCHSPHMSLNADLLVRTGQSQCLHCHESGEIFKTAVHQDNKETNCTECHNPHGGEDRNILR